MKDLLGMSFFFYEAQRAGTLPADNRVLWRGNSVLGTPALDAPFQGGWYDAGDAVKFNYNMFYSAARVALATWKYGDAMAAYSFDGQTNLYWAQRELKWVFEYIILCVTTATDTVLAQVGDGFADHSYIGRSELLNMARPTAFVNAGSPATDIIASAAAALANGYMVFQQSDPAFAATCLSNAESLYEWGMTAITNGKTYSQVLPQAQSFYASTGVNHAVLFAASSLFRATSKATYQADALKWGMAPEANGGYKSDSDWASWDNHWYEGALLLMDVDNGTPFNASVVRFLNDWVNGYNGITITPRGQRFLSEWGSNRYAANAAAIAFLAAPHMGELELPVKCFGVSQLHYIWGDSGQSFVVGAGHNPPLRPHHRNAACTIAEGTQCSALFFTTRPSPYVIHGAVVGGPQTPNDAYIDDRNNYVTSEVATDYNAMYTLATAAAISLGDSFWSAFPGNCVGMVPGFRF